MKRHAADRQNTGIELTSLLDVIFIVLMIVLCNQQINMQVKDREAKERFEEAEEALLEASAMQEEAYDFVSEKAAYEEQLKAYEEMYDGILSVTVYADYSPADVKTRTLRVISGSKELFTGTLTPQSEREVYREFADALRTEIAANEGKPVILTVSTEKILYRDEQSISEVLSELSAESEDIYYRNKGN